MIRFTFNYLKPVALFLTVLVMFQCCVLYNINPVTVDKAINKDHKKVKRIKIAMVDGEKLILDSIYYKDDQLYGMLSKSKKNVKDDFYPYTYNECSRMKIEIKIDENKIKNIFLYDRKKSVLTTVFVICGPIIIVGAVFGLLVYAAADSFSL